MATYREITYMVLDLLKERADDAYYTEEHIIFLADKMRALLLERKYKGSRNAAFTAMSDENVQEICVNLEKEGLLPGDCYGSWLKSVEKIPETLSVSDTRIYTVGDMYHSYVSFVPIERLPYVGYNKWLRNITYAAKSNDGYLYLSGASPQFTMLKKVKLSGIFSNPSEAAKLACDADGNLVNCEILDVEFPLETALVASCIELVVQELTGSRYAPEDKSNDAKDGFSDVALTNRNNAPVERTNRRSRSSQDEEAE